MQAISPEEYGLRIWLVRCLRCPRLRELRVLRGHRLEVLLPLFSGYTFLRVVLGWQARWTPGTFPAFARLPLQRLFAQRRIRPRLEACAVCESRFADLGGTAVSCSEAEFPRERARLETRARRRTP